MPGAQLLPGRHAGHRYSYGDTQIYPGADSLYGELGDAEWYPTRGAPRGPWTISVRICGTWVFLPAVMDDFGDLVAVPLVTSALLSHPRPPRTWAPHTTWIDPVDTEAAYRRAGDGYAARGAA